MNRLIVYVYLIVFLSLLSLAFSKKKAILDINDKKIPFYVKVNEIYRRITPCLHLTSSFRPQNIYYEPGLEEHFNELKAITAQYRGLTPHNGSNNYRGMSWYVLYFRRCSNICNEINVL